MAEENWTAVFVLIFLIPVGYLVSAGYSVMRDWLQRERNRQADIEMEDAYEPYWYEWRRQALLETESGTTSDASSTYAGKDKNRARTRALSRVDMPPALSGHSKPALPTDPYTAWWEEVSLEEWRARAQKEWPSFVKKSLLVPSVVGGGEDSIG